MAKLVLVNEHDEETGLADELECHQGHGLLHRAFTVFVFNYKGHLLIQKRSRNKLLWPLAWESSCSSHPLQFESYIAAGKKSIERELGIKVELELLGKFQYQASYKEIGSENELCALLVSSNYGGGIKPNPDEVADWRWIGLRELQEELDINSEDYAPWLRIALDYYGGCELSQRVR